MDRLRIIGGKPLQGSVSIAGAKNASLPQIAASLLSPFPLTLNNLPAVSDIANMLSVAGQHGVKVTRHDAHSATLDASGADPVETTYDTVRKMRATVLVLGPVLARFGRARVSLPGGCAIGARPVDLHVKALGQLGAAISIEGGMILADAPDGLRGGRIVLGSPSVGATETAMMAATLARGETEIINAAREPEVADLADCLAAMGAVIDGAGTHRILIRGETTFRPATHQIIPDRIEAGTYAIAAAITGGQLELANARLEQMASVAQVLEAAGVSIWPGDRVLIISRDGPLRGIDITTKPYPGFPTDLQAQFMALMTQAEGAAMIRETVFENRFMHAPELQRLGANIALQGTSALVRGGTRLRGAQVMATDLRASVSLVLAALVAEGETIINRVYHLDRGYEQLDLKLRRCGADITRLKDGESSSPSPLFLGVDGGGTGCRARIENAAGEVLGQGLSGPATTRLGIEAAWNSIMRAVEGAIAEAGLDHAAIAGLVAGIGLAGIGRIGAVEALEALPHPFSRRVFLSDGFAACLGAHSGKDGAIVIAGTGSIGIGHAEGRDLRVGGYGFPISDEGSGADLGLQAVRLALRAHDGRVERTALLREVMARFHDKPAEAVAWMDRASATEYATFAPMVMRHADQGDAAGRRIVQSAAEQVDGLIRALFDQGAPRVTLLGGLASAIEPWLAPDVRRRLKPADGDAVSGSIIRAKQPG